MWVLKAKKQHCHCSWQCLFREKYANSLQKSVEKYAKLLHIFRHFFKVNLHIFHETNIAMNSGNVVFLPSTPTLPAPNL